MIHVLIYLFIFNTLTLTFEPENLNCIIYVLNKNIAPV